MKKYRQDSNGVPILSRINIEEHAEAFIEYFDDDCLLRPGVTPLAAICTKLQNEHNVSFVFDKDLGMTKEGYKYRGCFHIPTTTILIDKNMQSKSPRFNFTLAHEIGHFVLHRKIDMSILKNNNEIKDTNRELILDQIESNNPRVWIEWQANKFASSLLMPRSTVPMAVVQKQQEMGLNRNIGKIYLDRGSSSYQDYKQQIEHLSFIYQTSIASVRIRLRELSILIEGDGSPIEPSGGPKPLSTFLSSIINDVTGQNG